MIKTEMDMAKNGEMLREYGTKYFLVISEALEIGRVKFSMVPIGNKGTGNIDFYMPTEEFALLCNEINDNILHTFEKKMQTSKNNPEPDAYKYMTGTDAHLRLQIGGGKVGCRVRMIDTAKPNMSYTMAVSISAFKKMAIAWRLYTGLLPCATNSYYGKLQTAFEEERLKRRNMLTAEKVEDDYKPPIDDSVLNIPDKRNDAPNKPASQRPQEPPKKSNSSNDKNIVKTGKPSQNSSQPTQNDAHPNGINKNNLANYSLLMKSCKASENGNYIQHMATCGGEDVVLLFDKNNLPKWYNSFVADVEAEYGTTRLNILGEKRKNFILYYAPAET